VDSFSGGFGANKFQGAFNKNSAAGMFGKQAASTSITSPMKDLKIKGGSFDMAGAAGVAGVYRMLGSAIGKGDGDAATF
jgi:hypothetical protein